MGKSLRMASTSRTSRCTVVRVSATATVLLRLSADKDLVALDLDGERLHRHHGGHERRFAGTHVEARAVARALDLVVFELPLVERAAVVRADVFDGVELAVDVADGDA